MSLAAQDNYKEAIEVFKIIVKDDPKDLDALFNMGLSYLNTSNGADTAVICFNKGIDMLTEEEKEGYLGTELGLSLGKAYQVLLKPLQAVSIYEELIENIDPKDSAFIEEVEREIQICHHADFFIKNPIQLTVKNMGSNVNSMYDDHSPLITVSESLLFFTSRRNWIKQSLLSDGQYAEKIYTVPLASNNWESARLLKTFFKQNEHEAAASLSPDGNQMVLFRNDQHGKSLYISNYNGKDWSVPEKLPFPINSYSEETHGSISADKSTFFFTSDREGGFGGLDIYMVKKLPNGNWGTPRNLGPDINTEFDEETPMIHYDGKTLYFSSEGHNTMGRLDVFYSQMNEDSTWVLPVNMGYPINTPDDDFFFVPTINKSHAYYASSKFADNYGGSDIYRVEFDAASDAELAVIEGEVDSILGKEYSRMRVLVTRTTDNQLVGDYRPGPGNGKYMMFLENGHEYQVKQLNIEDKEKVSYINVTSNMNYVKTKMPVSFTDIAMDAPLIKTIKTVLDNARNAIDQKLEKDSELTASNSNVPASTNATITGQETGPKPVKKTALATTDKVDKQSPNKKGVSSHPENIKADKEHVYGNANHAKNSIRIKRYTLQLMALKRGPLPDLNYFKKRSIENVKVYYCNDGFTRYTFGEFNSYKACLELKNEMLKYNQIDDIWIRPTKDFETLTDKNNPLFTTQKKGL